MPRIPRCPDSVPDREETAADLRAADRADPRAETVIRTTALTTAEISLRHRPVLPLSR